MRSFKFYFFRFCKSVFSTVVMAQISGVFEEKLQKNVLESKVLMVGAGGIGCELLKNLVLTGWFEASRGLEITNSILTLIFKASRISLS